MLITPPDLAWGLLVLGGCGPFVSGCLAASAPTLPSHLRIYRCQTPSLPLHWCGRAWWSPLRPILALAGRQGRRSTRQLYYSFTQDRLEPEHLSPAGGRGGGALPALGRTRLAVRPGSYVSPLVSGLSAGKTVMVGRCSAGESRPIMTEADVAGQCLGAGAARRGPRAHRARPAQ